jgi:hypothetical protein
MCTEPFLSFLSGAIVRHNDLLASSACISKQDIIFDTIGMIQWHRREMMLVARVAFTIGRFLVRSLLLLLLSSVWFIRSTLLYLCRSLVRSFIRPILQVDKESARRFEKQNKSSSTRSYTHCYCH